MKGFLRVKLWDDEIGVLMWDKQRKKSYFIYNPKFLKKGLEVAPLVASTSDIRSRMPIYGEDEAKYQKLPSFLADSLPDDWGNQLFEHWRVNNKISNADITALEKLAFIGKRGMGALEFEPAVDGGYIDCKIELKSLIDLAQRIFVERENAIIEANEELTLHSLIAVGTSVGGRQPKAIIAINKVTGEIRSGQISDLDDCEYYILKFGDAERSSAELEMVYYEMSRLAGIDMMPSQLLNVEGNVHFLTKRFDRVNGKKMHTQTLAALWPEADSYEKLIAVCRKMNLGENVCEEIFKRMVFNLLANNTDDHNKNITFFMNQQGEWRLAPAYDATFIFNRGGFLPQEERCLMIRGKLRNITKQDVLDFARDNAIRHHKKIIDKVIFAIKEFRRIAVECKVKEEWINRIELCLSNRLGEWADGGVKEMDMEFVIGGHVVKNLRIEQAYKGNYHFCVEMDGKEKKRVIRQDTDDYKGINSKGIQNLTQDDFRHLIEKYWID